MIDVKYGQITNEIFEDYLYNLVGRIYKILRLKEDNSNTLIVYLKSTQIELIGLQSLISVLQTDGKYLSIIGTLQYFIDNDADVVTYRREVMRGINTSKYLYKKYTGKEWVKREYLRPVF